MPTPKKTVPGAGSSQPLRNSCGAQAAPRGQEHQEEQVWQCCDDESLVSHPELASGARDEPQLGTGCFRHPQAVRSCPY